MLRRCLGKCGRLIERGSYCGRCNQGSGWGRGRDRLAQARFRKALMARAGGRCEYAEPLSHTWVRCTATTDLRACHFPPLAEGGSYQVTASDKLYCGVHDRMTDKRAR